MYLLDSGLHTLEATNSPDLLKGLSQAAFKITIACLGVVTLSECL